MKFFDIVSMSLNSLTHRKLRSWLTVLGIVIGVAAVIALISIGQGMQQSVQTQLGGLGANTVYMSAGFTRAEGGFGFGWFEGGGGRNAVSANLTTSDIRTIRATPGVQYVDGIVSGRADVKFSGQTASSSVEGVDVSVWKLMVTTKLESGRYLTSGDTYTAVIGYRTAYETYKKDIEVNNLIQINNRTFRVVGILQSSGSSFGGGSSDSTIYIPVDNARSVLSTDLESNQFSSITAQVFSSYNVTPVIDQLTNNLMLTRHVTNSTKDFTITSPASLQQSISSISTTMTYFLAGIAGISLLVGAIGIANTMFMSVIERTRQIGVLKSLGTTNSEVMKLFVTESGMLGLIGGFIGIIFGVVLSMLISSLIGGNGFSLFGPSRSSGTGFETVISPTVLLAMMAFSVFIGAVSGLFPARRAAKLQPVEALRYE